MSWLRINKLTEEDIIRNSKPNRLYSHQFDRGRFFQVVHQDNEGALVKLAPRTMMKIIYLKDKDDIDGFEIIKLIDGKDTQKVKLNRFNFQQLKEFLKFIQEIDLRGITER